MSPEEYQRLKEAEKAHLRKLKELKQAVRTLERQQSIQQALNDMSSASRDLLDEHAALVDRLALETAQSEARLDMALEADSAAAQAATEEEMEAALQQERARELVRQLKATLEDDLSDPAPPASAPERTAGRAAAPGKPPAPEPPASPEEARRPPFTESRLPEKTIGRMRPS